MEEEKRTECHTAVVLPKILTNELQQRKLRKLRAPKGTKNGKKVPHKSTPSLPAGNCPAEYEAANISHSLAIQTVNPL